MRDLVASIVAGIQNRAPFEPRETEIGSLEQAYRIQAEVNAALIANHRGRQIAGYKIAFNRRSSMDYYKLSEPCYAPLFSDQIYESGAALALSAFRDLVVEAEIALRVRSPLSGDEGVADVAVAIDVVFPAIELMDARGAFVHDPSAAAAVAQRVHNEGAVIGAGTPWDPLAVQAKVARLSINDKVVGEARDAAPQSAIDALSWLATRLGKDGLPLHPGMIVLTGAHIPGYPIRQPGQVRVDMEPLGSVSLRLF